MTAERGELLLFIGEFDAASGAQLRSNSRKFKPSMMSSALCDGRIALASTVAALFSQSIPMKCANRKTSGTFSKDDEAF